MSTATAAGTSAPLGLLIRVSLLQAWRRLKSIGQQSRLLTAFIGLFMFAYLWLSFWLFCLGLKFIGTFPGLGTLLTERLLFLLFAFLFLMLLFSNLVISYTNLFRNRETSFLMTLPLSAQTIFRWKLLESTVLASWAFLFLIAPLLAAYGLSQKVPWHFYFATVVLTGLFIVLPTVAGSWVAVNLARHMDRRAFQVVTICVATLLLIGTALYMKPEPVDDDTLETRVLAVVDRLLVKTQFAQFPLLPSYWLSASVLQWAEGALRSAGFFILVLLSHVLFFGFLSFTRMGNIFYDAASTVQSRGSVFGQWEWFRNRQHLRKAFHYARGPVEIALGGLSRVRSDVRAMVVKDIRMFWRDTTQWGQTLMLFGLLGVYIINLRHFSQQLSNPFWVHLISYLNLGACSLNLATLTTRFVYPQFSLEGKRLWIVGLAPLGLARVVLAKFFLATGASLVITLGLMWLSCHMLQLPWERTVFFTGAVLIMTFVLNGLAAGLGVLFPNFKEDHPGKIVSGFGGTFCLVLSFLYIVGAVMLLAFGSAWERFGAQSPGWTLASWLGFAVLSLVIGWLPLKLGLRKAANFEH